MCRIARILIIVILLAATVVMPVYAGSTADVTVTVTMLGGNAPPSGFTATYLDDNTVNLAWVKPASANNTMIRASDNAYPTSITDGYLVYLGSAVSANDTAVDYYNFIGKKYYAAWTDNKTDEDDPVWAWSGTFATAELESPVVSDLVEQVAAFNVLIGTISGQLGYFLAMLLLIGFLVFAFWKQDVVLYVAAGTLSIVLGVTWIDDYSAATIVIWFIGFYMIFQAVLIATKAGGQSRGISQFKELYNKVRRK